MAESPGTGDGFPDLAGSGWKPPGARGEPAPTGHAGPSDPPAMAGERPGLVTGEARDIRWRSESPHAGGDPRPRMVLTFRIHRHDGRGNWLEPVPVQMRGREIDGVLDDGDRVEARASWRPGQTLELTQLRNLTNGGAVVQVRDRRAPAWLWVLVALVALAVVAVFVAAAVLILSPPDPPFDVPGGQGQRTALPVHAFG